MKGRTIMGSYLNIHLNLFPIYVLLLLLSLSHGRPSARVKDKALPSAPYQAQKIIQMYNQISLKSSDHYNDRENELDPTTYKNAQQHDIAQNPGNKNPNQAVVVDTSKRESDTKDRTSQQKITKSQDKSDFQAFLDMNMDTQDEEEDDQNQSSILDKFRVKILNELGFNASANKNISRSPKSEISKEEYIRAYTEYMSNVKNRRARERDSIFGAKERRRRAISRVQVYEDVSTEPAAAAVTHQLRFELDLQSTEDKAYRVRRAILQLPVGWSLVGGLNGSNSIESNKVSNSYEEDYEAPLVDVEPGHTLAVDVTRQVSLWMVQRESSPFVLEVACSRLGERSSSNDSSAVAAIPVWPKGSKLKIVTHQISSRRFKRSPPKPTLNSFNNPKKYDGRDCSNTRHGKSCCRRSLKVKFSDLGISDEIMEPKEFDAHVCEGRCNARRVAYSSTHAMFQHILHQTKGKMFAPRPCCTPTKLSQLDVIIINQTTSAHTLHVVNLNNAIVKECGCS